MSSYWWFDKQTGWHGYEPQVNNEIARQAALGNRKFRVQIRGQDYIIDLEQMKQIHAKDSHKYRRIHCGQVPPGDGSMFVFEIPRD